MIHVSTSGKKVPCTATLKACPRGNAGHYPSIVLDLEQEGDTAKLELVNKLISEPGFRSHEKKWAWVKFIDTYYHFNENGEYVLNTELLDEELKENVRKFDYERDLMSRLAKANPKNRELIDYLDTLVNKSPRPQKFVIPPEVYTSPEAVNYILLEKSDALKSALLLSPIPHAKSSFSRSKINPETFEQLMREVEVTPESELGRAFLRVVPLTEDEVNRLYASGVKTPELAMQENISTDMLYDISNPNGPGCSYFPLRRLIERKDLGATRAESILESLTETVPLSSSERYDNDILAELLIHTQPLSPEYISNLISTSDKYSSGVIGEVVAHQNVNGSLDKILDNPRGMDTLSRWRSYNEDDAISKISYGLSQNKYLNEEAVVNKIINHENPRWMKAVAANRRVYLSQENVNRVIKDNSPIRVKYLATYRPLKPSQIDEIIANSDHRHDTILVKSQKLSAEQIDKIVSNPKLDLYGLVDRTYSDSKSILTQENFSKAHLKKLEEHVTQNQSWFYSDILLASKHKDGAPSLREIRDNPELREEYRKKNRQMVARRVARDKAIVAERRANQS